MWTESFRTTSKKQKGYCNISLGWKRRMKYSWPYLDFLKALLIGSSGPSLSGDNVSNLSESRGLFATVTKRASIQYWFNFIGFSPNLNLGTCQQNCLLLCYLRTRNKWTWGYQCHNPWHLRLFLTSFMEIPACRGYTKEPWPMSWKKHPMLDMTESALKIIPYSSILGYFGQ